MPAIDDLRAFDIEAASLFLWVFKKSGKTGAPPKFSGRWVDTSDPLEEALKAAVLGERNRIEEEHPYGLLAQTNEASALSIGALETHAGLVTAATAAELPERKVRNLKDIRNSGFYVVKLVSHDDDSIVYAVSRTDSSWRTKRHVDKMSAYFADDRLGLDDRPSFSLSRRIDFFIVDDTILVSNKAHFESILSYKAHHHEDFAAMRGEPEFLAVFSDIEAIVEHVGDNKIQLRRASAIRQKGYYKDPTFLGSLRENHMTYGLNLVFDDQGRIVPTAETCRDVFKALLDHRLLSPFSQNIYDVPDTITVNVG